MAGSDDALRQALTNLAGASSGRLEFRVRTLQDLGEELKLDLGRSPNPIYDFLVKPPSGPPFRSVAYTLALDGSKRPATRVEAFGRGLAAGDGQLFTLNPFLLVFDKVGNQFMAVSGLALFDTFAREAAKRKLASSESSTFSLTPNFGKRTLSLYAPVPAESLWYSTLALPEFSLDRVEAGLRHVQDDTETGKSRIPGIVATLRERIDGKQPETVSAVPLVGMTDDIKVPARIWQMVLRAIRSSPAVILVGPPGTGKTALLRKAVRAIAGESGFTGPQDEFAEPLWATPDESWTARELIGGDTIVDGAIQFQAGWVLRAVGENRWLVLDETNRADMDRIFGGLLTWLAGGAVTLGRASAAVGAPLVELGWNSGEKACSTKGIENGILAGHEGKVRYLAGEGWRLLGTYNALDAQRVFRFGAALGRRFVRVPIPAIEPSLFAEALARERGDLSVLSRTRLEALYSAHYENTSTQLGPAVFFAMCRYLKSAANEPQAGVVHEDAASVTLDEPFAAAGSGSSDAALEEAAFAEAYVVNVGTWLAHLEVRDRDALQARLMEKKVLSPDEWTWVATVIQALA